MSINIRQIAKLILPNPIVNWVKNKNIKSSIKKWEMNGRVGAAPQAIKQRIITDYQRKFSLDILIETGTYLGEMVEAQKENFKKIISIELDNKLYNNAKNKFNKLKHIELYEGDSGLLLEGILNDLKQPALFWLDGHYSEGFTSKGTLITPILAELDVILTKFDKHVILIDDARLFTGKDDYPTIEKLQELISKYKKNYKFYIESDIIRIYE
jgi:hypothetical protein